MVDGSKVDLTGAVWRRGPSQGLDGQQCVEVAFLDNVVAVRDGSDPDGTVLLFTREAWHQFEARAKMGEFDVL